jgi:hypothetical protein
MNNFTISDLAQTAVAAVAFALFLLPSGYLLTMAANAFGFRARSAAEQLLFSVALSAAVTPILAVSLVRFFSYRISIAIFLFLALISLGVVVQQVRSGLPPVKRSTWIFVGMALGWFMVVLFSLADMQVGHNLYVSYVSYDHSTRIPFVDAAARTGVPPLNPFYGLGKAPALRYYYYWYVVCALPLHLLGISAKACLDASVFWSGLGLASTIPLFLKHFLREGEHLRRKSILGVGLLAVTGLDLLPYAAMSYRSHLLQGDMEWWDPNQVTSWLGSLLWVPNHVASLTACMAGLLVLSTIDEGQAIRDRVWAVVISGLAFASAAGLSVYVTFTFAIFLILWSFWVLLQREIRTFATYIASGLFAVLLSWSFLLELLSKTGADGNSGTVERLAFIGFRRFTPAFELLDNHGIHSTLLLRLLDLPVLVMVYVLEFGFFFLAMALCFRQGLHSRQPLSKERKMVWVMFFSGILTMSFLRSSSTIANDLGFRGMLVVQFALLICSIPIVHDVFSGSEIAAAKGLNAPWTRICVLATLMLGVAGTAYQAAALRFYVPLADAGKVERSEHFLGTLGFGERAYWFREGFSRLDRLASPAASVQYNPVGSELLLSHLYSTHQAAMGDFDCGSGFGGDRKACEKAFPYFDTVFNGPEYVKKWDLNAFCNDFHVDVLVATTTDPVWQDPESWVWTHPVLYANPLMRAVRCGTNSI